MPYYSKVQVKQILDQAPPELNRSKIIEALVKQGHVLEGLNDQGFQGDMAQPAEDKSLGGFAGNVVKSGVNFVGGIANAVAHPIETAKTLGKTAIGGVEKLIPGQQDYEQNFDQLTDFFKQRYGSWDAVKQTAYEDPIGFLADASTVIGGAGGALKAVGLTKAGGIASKVATITDPLTAPTELGKAMLPSKAAGKLASGMYESALKPSTATFSQTERANLVKQGLREGVPVSKAGFQKAGEVLSSTNDAIDSVIQRSVQEGTEVSLSKMLEPLDDIRKYYKDSDTPSEFLTKINEYEAKVRADYTSPQITDLEASFERLQKRKVQLLEKGASDNNPSVKNIINQQQSISDQINSLRSDVKIPVAQAQKIKRSIYKQLGDAAYGELQGVVKESKKALARGAKQEIVDAYPELKALNAKDSELINLNEALEKAVNRIGNRELFGLREFGAMLVNPKLLIATIIDNPEIKSRVAILLQKVADKKPTRPGVIRRSVTPISRVSNSSTTETTE